MENGITQNSTVISLLPLQLERNSKQVPDLKNRTIGFNVKALYSGGLRNTPIDLEASKIAGETRYVEDKAYSLQAKIISYRCKIQFAQKSS